MFASIGACRTRTGGVDRRARPASSSATPPEQLSRPAFRRKFGVSPKRRPPSRRQAPSNTTFDPPHKPCLMASGYRALIVLAIDDTANQSHGRERDRSRRNRDARRSCRPLEGMQMGRGPTDAGRFPDRGRKSIGGGMNGRADGANVTSKAFPRRCSGRSGTAPPKCAARNRPHRRSDGGRPGRAD